MSRIRMLSRTSRHPFVLRHLDKLFFAVAAVLLGFCLFWVLDSWLYQRAEGRKLEELERTAAALPFSARAARAASTAGGLIGRIEISRLGLSAIIAEGSDDATLRRAVGHVNGTAFPGEPGNVGLAAHRDTFFRKLRNIAVDDTIRLSTPDGVFLYLVDTTMVVQPEREDVLDSTAVPSVTLVTCYPFYYIGHAPKRFIVKATRLPPEAEKAEAEKANARRGPRPRALALTSDLRGPRGSRTSRLKRLRRAPSSS